MINDSMGRLIAIGDIHGRLSNLVGLIDKVAPKKDDRLIKRESKAVKGNWADVRVSWGTKPEKILVTIKDILNLANKTGCKVYDGQVNKYITNENIIEIERDFKKLKL